MAKSKTYQKYGVSKKIDHNDVQIGDILFKDNGRNYTRFEVKRRNENGALIEIKESSFPKYSRFGEGKTVVVDESFLSRSTLKRQSKYKSVKQASDYIKEQVGIDISKYRNAASQRFEKRGQITIDISKMKKTEKNKLQTALNQKYSPFTGEQSGTWLFTISMKK